jgi:hypothetical protein
VCAWKGFCVALHVLFHCWTQSNENLETKTSILNRYRLPEGARTNMTSTRTTSAVNPVT